MGPLGYTLLNLLFIVLGYLSGSVLYAQVFARLLGKGDIAAQSEDHNPGTANAFLYGGFWCGVLTLIFDLLKGFLPISLFVRYGAPYRLNSLLSALVLAAPVMGHIFPLFYHFKGGKGIAVTFGCLAGLYPLLQPLLTFAFSFLLFSLVVIITPNYYRTIAAYILTFLIMGLRAGDPTVMLGFLLMMSAVLIRLFTSEEKRKRLEVKFLGGSHSLLRDRRRT